MRRRPSDQIERRRQLLGQPTARNRLGRNYRDFLKDGPADWVESAPDGRTRLYKYAFSQEESEQLLDFRVERRRYDTANDEEIPAGTSPAEGDELLLVSGGGGGPVREHRRAVVVHVRTGGRPSLNRRSRERISTGRVLVEWVP